MAQGEFTKAEANEMLDALREMWEALPKSKRGDYLGHFNDIGLFIEAARRNAPDEATLEKAGNA